METAFQPDQASAVTASRRGVTLPLLAAVLVMLSVLTIPRAPTNLDLDPDTSLGEVLSYAHQHGLQFGTDLVFTYGPLGYLTFFYFSPGTAGAHLVVDTLVCFTVAAGLCLVAWRAGLLWGSALIGVFMFAATNVAARGDLVMDAGLLCWGLLCFVESGRRLTLSAILFVALAVFGALAKTSVFFIAAPGILLLAGDLVLRGRVRLGAGMVAGFGAGIALGWLAAGQALAHLGCHLANALVVARAYNQALGLEPHLEESRNGMALMVLATGIVIIRACAAFRGPDRRNAWRRLLLLAWLCSLLFPIWKHGLVRGDRYHLVYFFGFVPVLALALEALFCEGRAARFWARALGITCCVLSLLTLQSLALEPASRSLSQPFRCLAYHARCLLKPGEYMASMQSIIETNRTRTRLPALCETIGHASVDVFGQQQIYALLNNLNYRPRPVFQSYAACNARLMRLNEQFYLSPTAPQYVMLALAPKDHRFPPLEDAMALRDLLVNYAPAGTEGAFLLLKRQSSQPPELKLLRQGVVRPGERIDLRDLGSTNLWLEIGLEPTWLGRLRELCFRPAPVHLAAWREGAKGLLAERRAPATMLAAGFVASPLLLRTVDVLGCYTGESPPRPDYYSVELFPEERRFWQETVRFRVYQFGRPNHS